MELIEPVATELDKLSLRDDVPKQHRKMCARLRDHLRRPIQIVVTGLAGSGKSALINMMLGRQVVDLACSVPVIDIVHGNDPRFCIERADGKTQTKHGTIAGAEIPEDAVRIRQELPDPALKWQSYRELWLPDDAAAAARVLQVAAKDANMFVWCTRSLDPLEQRLWSPMPDEIKDHSLAALTFADRLHMRGALNDTIARLTPLVGDDFLALYPVAATQGLAALNAAGGFDKQLWQASGGAALCSDIRRRVKSGRAEDIDRAQMILSGFDIEVTGNAPAKEIANAPGEPVAPMPANASVQDILGRAVSLLTQCGAQLLESIDAAKGADDADVLERCVAAVSELTSHLNSAHAQDGPVQEALRDAAEGEDMLMLLQLERGEDAAIDAVTLVLQLRKEMSARLAA